MTQITTELIKELRESTGISVMQCRKALEEAEGDLNKAIAILKKTSSDIALKKSSREAKDGRIAIKTENGKSVLISLNCETDFVSKNEDFVSLLSSLLEKSFKEGLDKMKEEVKEMIDPVIQKTGENIKLGDCYEITSQTLGSYTHNNKAGVIVSLSGGDENLAKDIAMHITAMKPEYIKEEDVDADTRKTVEEIFQKEISMIDKPQEIKQKMLLGKITTYFKEKTLLEQPFIKNADETVGQLLKKANATIKEVKKSFI